VSETAHDETRRKRLKNRPDYFTRTSFMIRPETFQSCT